MKRAYTITFEGKTILYLDFSGLRTEQDIASVINEGVAYIRSQPPCSVLTLSNVGAMHFNNQVKDMFIDFTKGNKEYMKASAVVGIEGFKQIVYNGVMMFAGRDIKSFTNAEEAKKWLIEKE